MADIDRSTKETSVVGDRSESEHSIACHGMAWSRMFEGITEDYTVVRL